MGRFSTDQAKTDKPTLFLIMDPNPVRIGIIKRIHYRINPTNAVTYTLRIWSGAPVSGAAYEINLKLLYESAGARVDDTDYDITELDIPFLLDRDESAGPPHKMFYSIDWTGAPGVTPGILQVSGVGAE